MALALDGLILFLVVVAARAVDGLLRLTAPPRHAELVLLGMVLGREKVLLRHGEDLLARQPRRVLEGLRVLVGDPPPLVEGLVGQVAAVDDQVGLLVALVGRACRADRGVGAVADPVESVPLEELL